MTPPRAPRSALARLSEGEPVFGIAQTVPNPILTEVALWTGFDFVMLDCEHGVIDEAGQLACLQVIERADAFSTVRVRPGEYGAVSRYLDFGADAVLMADVASAEVASRFVAAATVGPKGTRSSTGAARAARYGLGEAKSPTLIALIECADAVGQIDAIAATPGLHGLMIGPHDLSADLGALCEFEAAEYCALFAAVEQAAIGANLILGTRPHAGHDIPRLVATGHRLILLGSDIGALREGLSAALLAAHRAAGSAR